MLLMIKSGHNFAHVMTAHGMCKIVNWFDNWKQYYNKNKFYKISIISSLNIC